MADTPGGGNEVKGLRLLRILVTVLTATMIVGFIILIGFLVTRFPTSGPALPTEIALPGGAAAVAFTQGRDWYAVVTADDRILIYDRAGGALRQTIAITPGP